jgi:quercetin dioxygenase-like cupin family protein
MNMLIEFIKPNFEHIDARGSLRQLVRNGWKQVNYITSAKNSFRGSHYHRFNCEAFYVISGEFRLALENHATGEKEVHYIKSGDFFTVQPNIIHSFYYTEDSILISFYDRGVEDQDGDKDIYRPDGTR